MSARIPTPEERAARALQRAPKPGYYRLRMLVAYDGGAFRGWQSQATGDAVQDHLERAFQQMVGQRVVVHGAGRTDAGVHALGQVAHADVPEVLLTPQRWLLALNANLPKEARVVRATKAHASFHSQFDAEGKIYTYRIWNASFLHPLMIGRAWHVPTAIDLMALRQTAQVLEGTHDFASFAANRGKAEPDTVRTIHSIQVHSRGPGITLRFHGDGFLYRMVRLLTGSMVRTAQGRMESGWLKSLLAAPGVQKTKHLAPAEGLYLTRVLYPRGSPTE